MIDVVFLLLIFFMCTSSFRPPEGRLPTQLPREGPRAVMSDAEFDPIRLELRRTEEDVRVFIDEQACATMDVLFERLGDRRILADVPVLIEGQTGVPFGRMVAVLDTCYRADFHRVAFSAKGVRP